MLEDTELPTEIDTKKKGENMLSDSLLDIRTIIFKTYSIKPNPLIVKQPYEQNKQI